VGGGAGEGGDGEVSEGKQVWMFDTAVFCVSLKTIVTFALFFSFFFSILM
jgi:hypothetical protein